MLFEFWVSEPALLLLSSWEDWVDQVTAEMVAALAFEALAARSSSEVAAAVQPVPRLAPTAVCTRQVERGDAGASAGFVVLGLATVVVFMNSDSLLG